MVLIQHAWKLFYVGFSKFPLFFVACIGIIGTGYIFSTSMYPQLTSFEAEIAWNSNLFEQTEDSKFNSNILINGQNEVNRPIEFVVNGFNPASEYELDFGDGTCVFMNHSRIEHEYSEPGIYQISLSVHFYDESTLLENNQLHIFDKSP